jgi:hypothetical protein
MSGLDPHRLVIGHSEPLDPQYSCAASDFEMTGDFAIGRDSAQSEQPGIRGITMLAHVVRIARELQVEDYLRAHHEGALAAF